MSRHEPRDRRARAIGYLRVSTAGQEYGIEAQRSAISAEAERRGWEVERVEYAGRSGKDIDRPGIQRALAMLKKGEASALVVSKLDRLTRSLADFARLLEVASKQGWGVSAIDLSVDMTTATGRMLFEIMDSIAQWESHTIGQRTRDGLAEAKRAGARLDRPVLIPAEVEQRFVTKRRAGSTLAAIAGRLNDDLVVPSGGGRIWYPSTVRGVIRRAGANQSTSEICTITQGSDPLLPRTQSSGVSRLAQSRTKK